MRLILEQRNLLDASLVRTAESFDTKPSTSHADVDGHRSVASTERTLVPPAAAMPPPTTTPGAGILVVIDPRVPGADLLRRAAVDGAVVATLNTDRDGASQVTDLLRQNPGIKEVDLVAYGREGELLLGSGVLNAASLKGGATDSWRGLLSRNAEINVWGCDVARGNDGSAFVNLLSDHTGASVSASADAIGAADLGGNWSLETRTGSIVGHSPFNDSTISSWEQVLDRPNPVVTLTGLPNTVLLGQSFTETVSFQNTAINAAGYGPFIDVFLPTNSAEHVTFQGADFLGSPLSTTAVILSTDVVGHVGILGALHPLAVGTDGKPLFVSAPSGAVAGDTLEVIKLPFGSYTPGQPTANVTLKLTLDATSELTSTHPSSRYAITAVGGFQYGADPLNNPATDPSLRGNGSGLAGDSTVAAGAINASASVGLLTFATTINTLHGETETATGQNNAVSYNVAVTPATAVTAADPITGLKVTVVLPDDVRYTGGTITTDNGGTAVFTPNSAGADGGKVTVSYSSLSSVAAINIPVYVPQYTNTGAAILDPTTGTDPANVGTVKFSGLPGSTYANGTWNPVAGSLDFGTPTPVTGLDTANPQFYEKPLAVQETLTDTITGGVQVIPGDPLRYDINFQVSDYYGIQNLRLQTVIGDGVTLNPATAPVLTLHYANGTTRVIDFGAISGTSSVVNGQTVATSGSSTYWKYSRDNATTGRTTVSFDVGAALTAVAGNSVVQGGMGSGGAYGTLTLAAAVLDKYTLTNIDPNTGVGGSITERDTVTSTASGTADLLNSTGVATGSPFTDTSSTAGVVAQGGTTLKIVALNGVAVTGTPALQAGDLVTYEQDYTLVTGDYQNLQLLSFLPLPNLSVTDPSANSSGSAFTASGAGAYPSSGTYRLVSPPTGVGILSATVNGTSNSINFNLGDRSDTTNTPGQIIRIQYSAVVSDQPAADGLLLTTQGQALFTDAASTTASPTNIGQVTLREPQLVTKTGVVSVVNDSGVAKGTFTNEVSGTTGNPTTTFSKAGSSTVFTGAPPTTIADIEDLNAGNVDGGDTARIVTTVQNTGSAPNGAFDLTLAGTLPAGVTLGQISKFVITRGDGTVMAYTKPDGSAASFSDYFTTTGVMTEGPRNTASLAVAGDPSHRDILFVSYDIKLPVAQPGLGGLVLSSTGSIVNFSARIGGVANGRGFVAGGSVVGGTASQIVDDASTVLTQPPTLTKTLIATDIPTTTGNNVAVGETITEEVTVIIPEGRIIGSADGTGHVTITQKLAPNTQFFGLSSSPSSTNVTFGSGVVPIQMVSGSTATGQTVTLDYGTYIQNLNADANGNIKFAYQVKVMDGSNTAGTQFNDTTSIAYYGKAVPNATVTTVEVDPSVSGTINASTGTASYIGQVIAFTSTIADSGGSTSTDAYNTVRTITIPNGLTYVPGSLSNTAGTSPTSATVSGQVITISFNDLPVGANSTFTYQASVDPTTHANQTYATSQTTTYQSTPSLPAGRSYSDGPQTATVATQNVVANLSIVGEAAGTPSVAPTEAAPLSAVDMVVGDIVRLHGTVLLPVGNNTVDTVVTFNLPAGIVFTNDGTATLAFVSNQGIKSSTLDTNGTTPGLQVSGSATAFAPTYVIPASAITISGSKVIVDLGTLTNSNINVNGQYAVLELNGLVANVAGNTGGTVLNDTLSATSEGASSTSTIVSEVIKQPLLTLSKVATSVGQATGQVQYAVTITNTGTATAYQAALVDNQGANETGLSNLSYSGSATNIVVTSGNSTPSLQATMNLAVGASETFTYTATVANITMPVADNTAAITYTTLSGNNTSLTSAGLTSNSGTPGTTFGERTGDLFTANDTLNAFSTQGLGRESGRVWHDIGSNTMVYNPAEDVALAGVTVKVTTAGPDGVFGTADDIVQTTTTASDGTWSVALLPDGVARVTLSMPGSGGVPSTYTLVYNDGQALSNPAADNTISTAGTAVQNIGFSYVDVDAAPVLTSTVSFLRGSGTGGTSGHAVSLYASAGVSDYELDRIVAAADGSYAGTKLTLQRYTGTSATPNATDNYVGTGALTLSNGVVTLSNASLGTYTITNGILAIVFNASATTANIGTVITDIAYRNNDPTTFSYGLQFGTTIDDANTQGYQGRGGVMTSNVIYSRPVDVAPPVGAFIVPYTEGNNVQTSITPFSMVTLQNFSGPDHTFSSATVSVTSGYAIGEDVLAFTNDGSTMGNITGFYDGDAGMLTLSSSATATATTAQWQSALNAVKYLDISHVPSTATRSFTAELTDKDTGIIRTSASTNTPFTAVDDSPVLNSAIALTVSGGTENLNAPPSGAVGFLVSDIADRKTGAVQTGVANITDTDGNGVANGGSSLTPYGVAIIANDSSKGAWYFSTDNGANWSAFSVGTGQGLRLQSDARLYFQVTQPSFNGSLLNGLVFRAWDEFDGAVNGQLSAMPSTGLPGHTLGEAAADNSPGTAYSSATSVVQVTVAAVNDAPVATASYALASVAEDTVSPDGVGISVFVNSFKDSIDAQYNSVTNPMGSVSDTLAGIAIQGNQSTAPQGAWQYSSDAGMTWTAIDTGVSDNAALVLGVGARLRFVPAADYAGVDFNGTPGKLSFRIIESGSSLVGNSSYTGNRLQATSVALPGVDVSSNGGTTEISGNTQSITTHIIALNNAPVASGSATYSGVEDTTGSSTVAALMGQSTAFYSDSRDTVTSAPDGSTGTPLAGIAITGNTATAAQGVWQYSIDGGANWLVVGTPSDTSAVVLQTTDLLKFVPAPHYNGSSGLLTVHDSDGTDFPGHGAGVNILAYEGGRGGWSAGTVSIAANIEAVNNSPTGAALVIAPPGVEDTGGNGYTVKSLFGPGLSDPIDAQYDAATNPTGSMADMLAGVAIVQNYADAVHQGSWQYSVDNSTTWTSIGSVSNTNAVVLGANALVRFNPVQDFNGTPGGLVTRVIESSSVGFRNTGAYTYDASGNPVSGSSLVPVSAQTGVVLDLSTGSAVSSNTSDLHETLMAVNNAPVLAGYAIVPSSVEDRTPSTLSVTALLAESTISYSDARDDVTASTDGSRGTPAGALAIVGNLSTTAQGAWQYSLNGGMTWNTIGAVSDTDAVVLAPADLIRFLPAQYFNGTPGKLVTRVADSSQPHGVTDISTGIGGSGTWSMDTAGVDTVLAAVNNSPILDTPVASVFALPGAPVDITASVLAARLGYDDTRDTVTASPDGSRGTPFTGLAITGGTVPGNTGSWSYSTDGGTTFAPLPTGLSDTHALVLLPTDILRFTPTYGRDGTAPDLTVRASDGSIPLVRGIADVQPLDSASPWSVTGVVRATALAPNHAPVSPDQVLLPGVSEDAVPTGTRISDLFGTGFTDPLDAVNGFGNSFAGIAIVGNAVSSADGAWQYSQDGGRTWISVRNDVNDSNALVIGSGALLRFLPAPHWNGIPDPLLARVIENSGSEYAPGLTGLSLEADGSTDHVSLVYGGGTAVSDNIGSVLTSVAAVNNSPTLGTDSGYTGTLDTVIGVEDILRSASLQYSDALDSVPDAATHGGSSGTPASALAVIGNLVATTQGMWQYSTNGGNTWSNIPTGLSDTIALVLDGTDTLRFVAAQGFTGTVPALVTRISDSLVAGAGTLQDISTGVGGTGHWSVSTAAVEALVSLPPIPFVPLPITIIQPTSFIPTPIPAPIPAPIPTSFIPTPIPAPSPFLQDAPTPVFFNGSTFLAVDRTLLDVKPSFGLTGYDKPLAMRDEWLTGGYVYRFAEVERLNILGIPVDAFHKSAPGMHLTYEARQADGGALPPWLTFDPNTLTFLGVPPEGAEGNYNLLVTGRSDTGLQAEAAVRIVVVSPGVDIMMLALRLEQPPASLRGEAYRTVLPVGALGLPNRSEAILPRIESDSRNKLLRKSAVRNIPADLSSRMTGKADSGVREQARRLLDNR